MKKLISIILVMAIAITMPIFAALAKDYEYTADTDGEIFEYENGLVDQNTVPIQYGVSEKFTLEIPDFITFTDASLYTTGTIKGTNILLTQNQTLTVTVSSLNSWYMLEETQNTVKLKYGMALTQDGAEVTNNTAVFTASPQEAGLTKTQTLHCKRASTNQAGTYRDTLTFTCQIVTKKA